MEYYSKTPDKRKAYEKVVVDGDTLEKRREQRAEQLEKFVWEKPDELPGILDTVNQWTEAEGTKVVPSSQSVFDLEAKEKKLRKFETSKVLGEDLPPIVKRTPQQRIESLVERLKSADPAHLGTLLQDIAGEYWKAGMPVTTEDLRAVASQLLNESNRRKKHV